MVPLVDQTCNDLRNEQHVMLIDTHTETETQTETETETWRQRKQIQAERAAETLTYLDLR